MMNPIRLKLIFAGALNLVAAGAICGYSSKSETVMHQLNHILKNQEYWNVLALAYIGIVISQMFLIIVFGGIYILSDQSIQTITTLYSKLREIYFKEYYAIVIINKLFLLIFQIILISDPKTLQFETSSSYHFSSSFYLSGLLFYYFSKEMLNRRVLLPNERIFENEGVFRCAYEVIYFVETFFIVFSFLFVVKFDEIRKPADQQTKFIIYSLTYAFYSLTKLGILVNIFLLVSFIKLVIESLRRVSDASNPLHVTILSSIFGIFSFFYICYILLKYIRGYFQARRQYELSSVNNNQPPDLLAALNLLPPRPNIQSQNQSPQRDYLIDQEIDQLIKITFQTSLKELNDKQSEEQIQKLSQEEIQKEYEFAHEAPHYNIQIKQQKPCLICTNMMISNAKKSCSICDSDFIPKEKIVKLRCNHMFHFECIRQWLKRKNSCPNCRQIPFDLITSQMNQQQQV